MKIYKFRIVIDLEEDIFRDIEIKTDSTFLELHDAIKSAFDFEGQEMASFYMSNESWDRGQEIPLEDMGVKTDSGNTVSMKNAVLSDFITSPEEKIVYVYDFLRMWCFYIELLAIKKAAPSTLYPRLSMVYGDAPKEDDKEMDLFMDVVKDDSASEKSSTGDPELDAYLNDDDEDEEDNDDYESLDDLDQYY